MANATATDGLTGMYTGGIPLNVTLHAWPVPKLEGRPLNESGPETVGISESAKNYTNSLGNLNATGFVAIEDDLTDTGFTDVQTFILAGIATVIPLAVVVATILGIRFVWRRCGARKEDFCEGVLQKEGGSEPKEKRQGHSPKTKELKTTEFQCGVTPEDKSTDSGSPKLPTAKSNGSIITMTLKNNHLIVETEETANTPTVLKVESKGTTTTFVTPGGRPDFRIERENGSGERFAKSRDRDHGALVHRPPEAEAAPAAPAAAAAPAEEEEEVELDRGSCNTGLSQSDLSISSAESQNPGYRYGNQLGYEAGGHGDAGYSGSSMKRSREALRGPQRHQDYCRSFATTERTDSVGRDQAEEGDQPLKNVLLSDIQAEEKRIEEDEEVRYQEEQIILGNGGPPDWYRISASTEEESPRGKDNCSSENES